MQAKPRFLTLSILIIIVLILGVGPGSAQDDTTLTLTLVNLAPGDSGTVEGHINCMADGCSAFAVTLSFDPAILQVDSADAGPYLGDQVFVADNVIDNEGGVVRLAAVALGDPGETENDLLFELAITALAPGVSMLRITDIEVGDLIGNPLPVEAIDSAVVVSTDAATPAPEETPESTEEPESTGEPEITDPCTVRTDEEQVPIRVGPGSRRGVRGDMPVDVDVPVVGQFEDDDDNLWWKIQPEGYDELEADRYWVAAEDVEESGDCEDIGESEASTYIPGQVSTATPEPTTPGDVSPAGPVCGNGVCEAGEDSGNCRGDCGAPPATCGNGRCGGNENCSSCPADCGACTPVPQPTATNTSEPTCYYSAFCCESLNSTQKCHVYWCPSPSPGHYEYRDCEPVTGSCQPVCNLP